MTKYKLEYIWLDGYTPVPNLRGKTQIKEFDSFPALDQLPLWGFDGSSTMQAEGHSSDCVLKPVAVFPDGARKTLSVEHPTGEMSCVLEVDAAGAVTSAALLRTARKLMDGVVFA